MLTKPCTILFPVLLSLGIAACKKVINVDLKTSTSQVVIEGEVTNAPGPYHVRISRSVNFSASNDYPPVSGALVKIVDSATGMNLVLQEADSGDYVTNSFTGTPQHTYTLDVKTGDKEYIAYSTMPKVVVLDSVTFIQNIDLNNKPDINAVVNFQDPPGLGNYYQFIEVLNGREIPNVLVFEDRLSDGRYIEQPLFNDSAYLQPGDTLQMSMYCVDKNVYSYLFSLISVTGNNSFQSATPANPISNISNGALGYFSAHTVTRKQLTVY